MYHLANFTCCTKIIIYRSPKEISRHKCYCWPRWNVCSSRFTPFDKKCESLSDPHFYFVLLVAGHVNLFPTINHRIYTLRLLQRSSQRSSSTISPLYTGRLAFVYNGMITGVLMSKRNWHVYLNSFNLEANPKDCTNSSWNETNSKRLLLFPDDLVFILSWTHSEK